MGTGSSAARHRFHPDQLAAAAAQGVHEVLTEGARVLSGMGKPPPDPGGLIRRLPGTAAEVFENLRSSSDGHWSRFSIGRGGALMVVRHASLRNRCVNRRGAPPPAPSGTVAPRLRHVRGGRRLLHLVPADAV